MNILHYELLALFKKEFYKNLLTIEHLESEELRMNKIAYPNGDVEEDYNLWGYVFRKNGVKYVLPSKRDDGTFIKLKEVLPVLATNTQKISHGGKVYQLIEKPISAKFQALRKMSFRSFINKLSSLGHTNPSHQKLSWFIGLSHLIDRSNSRISSPPSFGKDSVVDILGNLVGGSATIVSPTLAKLEYMTNYKWLAVNEVVDIQKAEWRPVEQFLLDAGAFKPVIAKHSRAVSGTTEELDISDFSISLLYNDIDNYSGKTQYFDLVSKDAVKDRFPAFRLYGGFTEDFNKISSVNINEFVREHFEEYKDLIYTFTYFKTNFYSELHHYNTDVFDKMLLGGRNLPERWKTNIGKILKIVDLYCDSQEEFDGWTEVIKKSMLDYQAMLAYPVLVEEFGKKVKGVKFEEFMKSVMRAPTFLERNRLLLEYGKPQRIEDSGFW